MHIALEQLSHPADAVLHGSAEAIELGDQELITRLAGINGPLQLHPLRKGGSTGDVLTEELINQGSFEPLELVLKFLGRCGATRITNECHRACAVSPCP